jgi:Cytosol aminopeptidase family, catalytic domain
MSSAAPAARTNSHSSGAVIIALGENFSGVFPVRRAVTPVLWRGLIVLLPTQTSDSLWEELHVAGETEYDRFWRMPLDQDFGPQIYSSNADLCNVRLFLRILSLMM